MNQASWEASSLERIPDAERHKLDELLFTPAWDNVVLVRTLQRPDQCTITGEPIILARLKYNTAAKIEVLPKLFQRNSNIKIRADVLNQPYLVLYPWHKNRTPPPCIRLMNAMLEQSGLSAPGNSVDEGPAQMCIAAPQSIVLPAAASPARATATPYTAVARSLPPPQAARLADALFMQATAMHLFQMHSALPPHTLSTHLTRDRLLAEELTAGGSPPGQPCVVAADAGTPSGSPGSPRPVDPTQGWCEDYRTLLKLSTVFPLKLQRHHTPVPAERPTLAVALLRRWTGGDSCLRHRSDRRVSAGVLPKALNLTAYSEWSQVPPEERADVQPLCMHPRTLAEAVIQLHANKSRQYLRLQWDGLRPVLLSVALAQGFAALACCVNEALLRYHMRRPHEATYV